MEGSAVSRQYLAVIRKQLLADDPGVSARSSTQRRRRCVLAASTHDGTSLEDDGVVERRWWQPTTATPAFRTLHTRRGCLDSSATTGPASLHGDDDWLWTRTTSQVTAGSRKWSRLLVTRLQSAPHDVCSCRQIRLN